MMKFSDIKLPSNERFGSFLIFCLSCLVFYFLYKSFYIISFFIVLIIITILFIILIKPSLLTFLNKSWMFIGYMLSLVVSPIVLGIMFYLIITPVAILLRLIGRDELKIKNFKSTSSWNKKNINNLSSENFRNQF